MTSTSNSDADFRAQLGQSVNLRCPNFSSHYENAADRTAWNWRTQRPTWDQQHVIDTEAEAEYLSCDGH